MIILGLTIDLKRHSKNCHKALDKSNQMPYAK